MRVVTFEFGYNEEETPLEAVPWFFSPSTQHSPHTFIMQPGDRVLIMFNSHDLLYRFQGCCGSLASQANSQLVMMLTNINHIHRIVINKHATLENVLTHPGIKHQLVAGAISELADMNKDPRFERITFDQPNHELNSAWTVGIGESVQQTVAPAKRPPLKQIFAALRDQPPLEESTQTPHPFWLRNPKLWRRAGGNHNDDDDDDNKENPWPAEKQEKEESIPLAHGTMDG